MQVYINVAMTADGKIATANRRASSFSSKRDKEHMMELRATADAVMSGARTVDLNPVTMGPGSRWYRELRVKGGLAKYNLRVIASRRGTVNPEAEIFKHRFSPIIILTTEAAGPKRLARLAKVADEVKVLGQNEIDFREAMNWLARKWKVRRLLCEGGGEINDALFRAGVVNEVHLTICPKVFGGRNAPTLADGLGQTRLADAAHFKLMSTQEYGPEVFLVYRALPKRRPHQAKVSTLVAPAQLSPQNPGKSAGLKSGTPTGRAE
jgi:2,5-diamino-6-(ribosylamino)-4(3H)-pyrimidinone 5'-phosphate reductase